MDWRSGCPMSPNLAEYHVSANADVPVVEAILVEEHDPYVNALGIKGVGEIGIPNYTAGDAAPVSLRIEPACYSAAELHRENPGFSVVSAGNSGIE